MHRLGASIIGSGCLAALFLACSSQNGGSSAGSGGSSNNVGSGGSAAKPSGGSSGMSASGTGGSPGAGGGSPGAGGSPGTGGGSPGTGGGSPAAGGSPGTGGGSPGTGGGSPGGSAGSPGAGGGSPGAGGSAGSSAGGSAGSPGAGGSAGSPAGGSAGSATGGSAGSAGAPSLTLPLLVTSANNALWQKGTITAASGGTATITVNDSQAHQTFLGFGGSFNEKGWSYLSQLSASDQAKALSLLYDATDGANFQFGRIPIGANDYSVTMYSEDDTANDTSLASFSIGEDEKYIIPYIQAALAVNPKIHFWGSPWSPPGWMKSGGDGTLSLNHGTMKNDDATFTAYASYFVKWVQAYAAKNITIEAIAPQNEPNYSEAYPSCQWKAADYAKFVGQYLGPALQTAKLNTSIILGTMSRNDTNSGTSESDQTVVTTTMADATAKGFITGFGLQWNMMQSGAIIPSAAASSNLPKWQTEHKCGNYSWGGAAYGQTYNSSKAPNDFGYAEESWGNIHDWLTAGVSVYSAWNMVLDPIGMSVANWPQETLIVADPSASASTTQLSPKPAYYAFRHFSQYTQPGATRVGTTGDVSCSGDGIGKCGNGIAAIAFKNPDNTHVVVLFNNQSSSASVTLGVGSTNLQFMMAANSFATVVN
jgi:glucosylceramidase